MLIPPASSDVYEAKSMSTWIWVSRSIEKRILEECIPHIEKVSEVAKSLRNMVGNLIRNGEEAARRSYEEVFRAEREADAAKKSLLDRVSREVLQPIDREFVIRLVLRTDDIADYAKASARRILVMLNLRLSLGRDLLEILETMSSKLSEASELLVEAVGVLPRNPHRALEIAEKIERIEEEVDDVRMRALELTFRRCREKSADWCLLAKDIVDSIENSVDRCEDAADIVRSIAMALI